MNTTLFFYLVHPLVALFASVGYAIVCNAPRKEIPYCGLTAFLCWLVYQLVLRHDGSSFLATLLATFAATGFARFLSYHRMLPTIVYHIPGILPLVPGAAVYRNLDSRFRLQLERSRMRRVIPAEACVTVASDRVT